MPAASPNVSVILSCQAGTRTPVQPYLLLMPLDVHHNDDDDYLPLDVDDVDDVDDNQKHYSPFYFSKQIVLSG